MIQKLSTFKLRNLLLLVALIGLIIPGKSEENLLSPKAEFSILTCGPGSDLYSIFGHTAIRLYDVDHQLDIVFNYGTFAFSDDFYFQFTMGKLNYRLSAETYASFIDDYRYENRWVYEQKLNLDSAQNQALFNFISKNILPENRHYLYDFFYDNCSTRPRDVLEQVLGNRLKLNAFSEHTSAQSIGLEDSTFRNIIDPYMLEMRWSDIGIDLGLGLPCDRICTPYQKQFLPDNLLRALDQATITNANGQEESLVSKGQIVLEALPTPPAKFEWFQPLIVFLGFVLLHLLILFTRKKWLIGLFDGLLYTVIGLAGWLLFFLWFITDHDGTRPNLNVLWAFPLYFPFGILFLFKKSQPILKSMMQLTTLLLALCILSWPLLPQNLNESYLPLLFWLLYRNLDALGYLKRFKA